MTDYQGSQMYELAQDQLEVISPLTVPPQPITGRASPGLGMRPSICSEWQEIAWQGVFTMNSPDELETLGGRDGWLEIDRDHLGIHQ